MNAADRSSEAAILRELVHTPELFAALERETGTELQVQSRLRERFRPELVRAALQVVELRRRASDKFSRAAGMWLSRTGLEQATPELVARYKANRFRECTGEIWDLCCGIGGDAVALAASHDVVAVDRDPAACLRTELNAAVYGVRDRVTTHVADVAALDFAGRIVHIDPDRRNPRGRVRRIEQYNPDLDWLQKLTEVAAGGAIKVSPASNFGGKFPDAGIELISLHGECKEATVWFGELRGEHAWRATVLPAGESLAGDPLSFPTDVRPPGKYLFDPDPAVVRAGLVDAAAQKLGLWRLDSAEEYLSGDALIESPFVHAFEIEELLPNNDGDVRQAVRQAGLGSVEIKCRHVPVDADAVRRKLPLEGNRPGVLIYARIDGRTRVVRGRRVKLS